LVGNRYIRKYFTGFQFEVADFMEDARAGVMALKPRPGYAMI
jgi:hypothetical protein